MYWTDAKSDRIEMADMDGSNVQIIMGHNDTLEYVNGTAVYGAGLAHYFGVAVDKTHIYFSDWKRRYVHLLILHLSCPACMPGRVHHLLILLRSCPACMPG